MDDDGRPIPIGDGTAGGDRPGDGFGETLHRGILPPNEAGQGSDMDAAAGEANEPGRSRRSVAGR